MLSLHEKMRAAIMETLKNEGEDLSLWHVYVHGTYAAAAHAFLHEHRFFSENELRKEHPEVFKDEQGK